MITATELRAQYLEGVLVLRNGEIEVKTRIISQLETQIQLLKSQLKDAIDIIEEARCYVADTASGNSHLNFTESIQNMARLDLAELNAFVNKMVLAYGESVEH